MHSILGSTLGVLSAKAQKSQRRTHLKSFSFSWKSSHRALHTGGHSWCTFCEVAKKNPNAVHTRSPLLSYRDLHLLHSMLGPTLVALSAKAQKSHRRTHLKSFSFMWKSSHLALHIGAQSWCTFCEGAKVPAPYTPEILQFSNGNPLIWHSILGPTLGALSAKAPKSQRRTHLKSYSFKWKSTHLAFHTGAQSWCTFCRGAKVPAPYTPEILYFPMEILTLCTPYWGLLFAHFLRRRKNFNAVHT